MLKIRSGLVALLAELHRRERLFVTLPSAFGIFRYVGLVMLRISLRLVTWLVSIPIHVAWSPQKMFQASARRRLNGEFLESYARLLQERRMAVLSVVMALFVAGIQIAGLGFSLYEFGKPQLVRAAAINVSGTLYSDEGSTVINCSGVGNERTVAVSVNGGAPTTSNCTLIGGTYSIGVTVSAAGDVLTVFLDGETEDAVTVTRTADGSSSVSGVNLYQNRLIVRHEDAGPTTNANLDQYDNGNDADIPFTVTASALTVNTGTELHVWTGKTYDPGGDVDTNATGGDLHVDDNATAEIDTATSTIGRDVLVDTGATLRVNGSLTIDGGDLITSGTGIVTTTVGTPTTTLRGTGNIGGGSAENTFYNLTIGDATAAATTVTSNLEVTNTLTVDTGDTLTIDAGDTINLSCISCAAFTLNGTLNGPLVGEGTLWYRPTGLTGAFPTSGTINANTKVRFSANSGPATHVVPGRTFGGTVELYSSATTTRTLQLGSVSGQTLTISGDLRINLTSDNSANATIDGATYDPTVNVSGSVDFIGTGTGIPIINAGTETWTVGNDVDFSGGQYNTEAGNTLTMTAATDGTATLTTAGNTLNNFTTSGTGTITLANATHTVNGNLTLGTTATISAGTSKITMLGTSNTITGGGQSLYELTIDPASSGTITLQSSNLTVTDTLSIHAGDHLAINSGITLTNTDPTDQISWGDAASTISGAGTLRFTDVSAGPGTGGVLSSVVRYDATTANILGTTFDARTYGGKVELYMGNTATVDRTVFCVNAATTYTLSGATSHFHLINDDDQNLTLDCDDVSDPALTIGGDLDYTGTGGGSEGIIPGGALYTISGNIDFTGGTYSSVISNEIIMNGNGKTIVGNNQSMRQFTVSLTAASITVTANTSGFIVTSDLAIGTADTLSISSGVDITMSGDSSTTLTMNGSIIGDGRLIYQNDSPSGDNEGLFPTGGTFSAALRFDTVNGDFRIPQRTYGGQVEVYGASANPRTVTLGTAISQTITFSNNFIVTAEAGAPNHLTVEGTTWNPAANITGNLDYAGTGTADEIITSGTGTWTVGGNVNFTDGTYTATSGNTLTMNGTGTLTTSTSTLNNFTTSGTSTITLANATHTISGDITLGSTATIVAGTSTVLMNGLSKTLNLQGQTFNNLTIDPTSASTIAIPSTGTVSNTLTVASGDTLQINTSFTLTLSCASCTALTLNDGTITGGGRLEYQTTTDFPSTGTISLLVRFRGQSATAQRTQARTFGAAVEVYSDSAASTRTLILGDGPSQTVTFSSDLTIVSAAGGTQNVTVDGATNNPTVNVTGNLDYSGSGTGTPIITSGTAVWTVGGNVDFTAGTYTATAGNTLKLNGTGTLTSNGNTLQNLTLDTSGGGTVTLANATHTVAGNLVLTSGGTLTDGGTLTIVTMTGTGKNIDGGGKTLRNLTISGTETLQNTDLTVASLLTVDTSKSITINASRTLTLSGNSGTTLTLSGIINGPGRLAYQNSATTFPTGGTLAATPITRFDSVNGNMVIPARTDYGVIEAFGDSANPRTVTLGAGTIAATSDFRVVANAASPNHITLQGATNDSTLTVGGDFDFTGTNTADELVIAPDAAATWTVAGHFDISGSSATPWTAGTEILKMTGDAKNLIAVGETIGNVTIDGTNNTVNVTGSDVTVSGTLTIGGDEAANNDTLSIAGSRTVSAPGTTTLTDGTDTISGAGTLRFTDTSSGPGTTGNLSSIVRYDATAANIAATTFDARTYGGKIELYMGNTATANRTVSCADASTYITSGAASHLYLIANGAGNLSLLCDTATDPTITIGGDLDYTGTDPTGTEIITSGTGTWTVGGNVDFTGGTYTATSGNTLAMNGTAKSLSTAGNSLQHFSVTGGSVSMADAATLAANLSVSSGTLTAPASTLTIGGSFTNSGTFAHSNGTVALNTSSTALVSGATTFNNLTSTVAGKTIQFQRQSSGLPVFTVAGSLTLTGASGNRINLQSDLAGTQWLTNFSTAQSATTFVAVRDAGCAGGSAAATLDDTSLNAGNNGSCWSFASVSVSVSDGSGSDVDFTNSLSQLAANWTSTTNAQLDHYAYAVGTQSGGTDVAAYTSVGLATNVTRSGLTLSNGTMYYVTVQGRNSVDISIGQASSDGVLVDTEAAVFSSVAASTTNSSMTVTWTSSEGTTSRVQYGVSASYGSETTEDVSLVTSHSVTVTGLASNTTYHFRVLGSDRAGNTTTSSDYIAATGYSEATVITKARVEKLNSTVVRVRWTTNHAADSKVRYGRTTDYGGELYDPTRLTDHALTITGLEPNTQHHYEIISTGNTVAIDADATFTTLSPGGRAIGPTLLPPLLADGEYPRLTVIGLAKGKQTVRIYVDGKRMATVKLGGKIRDTKPFATVLKLDGFSRGRHVLYAQSTDQAGRTSVVRQKLSFVLRGTPPDLSVRSDIGARYTVQPGESLWEIAERYLGDGRRYLELVRANAKLFPSLLTNVAVILIGWILTIPGS